MRKGSGIKWSPAVPCRRPDGLVSSRARENGDIGFRPIYENEPRENMNFIMSNEYSRIWFKQRAAYELDTYTKLEVEAGAGDIKRRFVQRHMRPRPGKILPIITLKRFANPAAKVDNKRKKENPASDAA